VSCGESREEMNKKYLFILHIVLYFWFRLVWLSFISKNRTPLDIIFFVIKRLVKGESE